ncbi:hypothetical protein GCM10010193_11640 [Kitasatospora atroaurantiaca]|uniref:Uncharacterized protein DUF4190 n=1 Tax=Kitasatospora atroaurantiaca TaxID=285545 RepID=A0A561EQG9_9ACTN|nr:DUF1707 and DUF4190 domain-containing protein [Kitasatospora atroaurantiaca]TWE17856.1 uncharacterized protein DUF4190 [Kitasatospora atroaurantiaca]
MAVQPWGPQPPYGAHPHAQPPAVPHAQPWQPAASPQSAMRAAHTDRERTVDVLKAAYAEGRLSAEEYAQRFDAAYQAKTYGQLAQLVTDLPAGPMVAPLGSAMPVVPQTFLPPPARPRTNPVAITAMALGLLCVPTFGALAVPAVVAGHVAKSQIRTRGEEGDGMATAGLVFGWLSIGGWTLLVLLALLLGG